MERMLVVVFDNERMAFEGRSALRELARDGSIVTYAQAVVVKQADGTASVRQFDDEGPVGMLLGTSIGSLIGLLGGPTGLAIGAVSGLAFGALSDLDNARVGEDFIDDVTKLLTPGKVAVIAEIEEEWTMPVDTRMEALGGAIMRRAMWEVRNDLRNEEIAAMKADLVQLKEEAAKAEADHRARLQSKIHQLQAKIEAQQKKAKEQLETIQARQASKRELLRKNTAAAGKALKELAETPV